MKPGNDGSWPRILLIAGIGHFLLLLFLGLTRHWSFLSSAFDLGIYDQSLWGILHGAPFLSTANELDLTLNRLGVHFNPLLALFAPLYAIHPAAEWLVLIQALAISLTAWPLYLLGRAVGFSKKAASVWCLAFLFNPFVISAAAWDFHPVSLAAPFMALGMFALEEKRVRLMLLSCLALLLIREHYGVAVCGFGVLWFLRHRSLRPTLLAMGMGVLGFLAVVGVIMPALSPTGGHLMMSEDLGQLSRYGWLGSSLSDVLQNLLLHPILAARTIFVDLGGGLYLGLILLSMALTPLAGPEFLLPGVADLAANLLSANPMPRSVLSYHSIGLIPVLFIAGMHGARRLSKFDRYSGLGLGRLVFVASLFMAYWTLPLPLPGAANIWEPAEYRMRPSRHVEEIRAILPPDLSLSAQANVAPHLTQRRMIRTFPAGLGEVDCAVLRLVSPTKRIHGTDPGEVGSLAHHLQMSPGAFLAEVREVVLSDEFDLSYREGGWVVLCQGEGMGENDRSALLHQLEAVAEVWLGGASIPPQGEAGIDPAAP